MELSVNVMLKLLYALGIGVLIGVERSLLLDSSKGDKDIFMGIRTYSILSLGGFSAALLGKHYPLAAMILIAGYVTLIVALYLYSMQEDPGITTEIAAVACCGLGALCFFTPHIAGVIALIITILLASKRFTNKITSNLHRVELTDTLKFLAIILIILPLLPNRALDPLGAFNPYKVTFLVILISGISFVGYFLAKFLGAARGLGLTGLLGGLTSSTAVTAAMAAQAKQSPGLISACGFATIIANATMFVRVLVVVALLDRALIFKLVWPLGTMTLVVLVAATILWLNQSKFTPCKNAGNAEELNLKNPFSLGPALKFSLFFVAILLVAKVAKIYLGDKGLYLTALVSGLADVDAITLTVAEQTKSLSLTHETGAIGITIAVVSNSIVKSGIAIYSGGIRFGWIVSLILIGATMAGLGVLIVV
nr:DUF4010 domain-containing protein [uncultured Desulfobacter sp.]